MQEVGFPVTAATKTWLGRDLAGVSDATQEQFHLESHWWGGTATVRHCVGDRRFQKLDSSQNTTLHSRARKKKISSQHAPPLSPSSLPLSSLLSLYSQSASGTQTGGDVRNCTQLCAVSDTGTCTEDPNHLQLVLLNADWLWLSEGLAHHSQMWFFFCLTDHETSSSIEEQIHPLRKKPPKNPKIKPLLL